MVIDLIEIGAGGGSLARVDNMGLLKVGPDSAGLAKRPRPEPASSTPIETRCFNAFRRFAGDVQDHRKIMGTAVPLPRHISPKRPFVATDRFDMLQRANFVNSSTEFDITRAVKVNEIHEKWTIPAHSALSDRIRLPAA